MSIIILVPRTRQPTAGVGIAAGNSLAHRLHYALGAYTGGQFLRNPLNAERVVFGSGSGVWGENWTPGVSGMEMLVSNSGAGIDGVNMYAGDAAGSGLPWTNVANTGWTLSIGVNLSGYPVYESVLFSGENVVYKPLLRVQTDNTVQFVVPGSFVIGTTSEALVAGTPTVITLSNRNNVGFALYFNNRVVLSGTDGGFPWHTGTRLAILPGFYCNGSKVWAPTTWKRALSPGEVASYVANIWQLFAPLPRRYWSGFAAGATAPTLSAATVTAIRATQATPRVTVTF